MPDMLVKLYDIPDVDPIRAHMFALDVKIRRAMTSEKRIVIDWLSQHYDESIASECETAFHQHPVTCYLAVKDNDVLGVACYDVIRKGIYGPLLVHSDAEGYGIERALVLYPLHSMWEAGYGYAIVNDPENTELFADVARALVIEHSTPGVLLGKISK